MALLAVAGAPLVIEAKPEPSCERSAAAGSTAASPVEVALPTRATDPIRITDSGSGVSLAVRLLHGAAAFGKRSADGHLQFKGVWPGVDTVIRSHRRGFEDLVSFAHRPARESVDYSLELQGVAGVRLVDRVVELLDTEGAPRLRMARPWIRGADGVVHQAQVKLTGCAVDTDPRAPWSRLPSPPGSAQCALQISWEGAGVSYPALLDPAWSSTGDMVDARGGGAACRLLDGRVLVVGGAAPATSFEPDLANAEIFDPATQTWSPTSPMATKRERTRCVTLLDGRVLVAGGSNALLANLPTSEVYQLDGSWTTQEMPYVRANHSLTLLLDGRAVAIGGDVGLGQTSASADAFDPVANEWSVAGSLLQPRRLHSAELLPDGRVLVAGGNDAGDLSSVELFDPASGLSEFTGSLTLPRNDFPLVRLTTGLFAVGGTSNGLPAKTLERYDVELGSWEERANLPFALSGHFAIELGSGQLLVAGGTAVAPQTESHVYEPSADVWNVAEPFAYREAALAVALADGSVLVTGGYVEPDYEATATSLVFRQLELGEVCVGHGACASTHCADGVCCESACNLACEACSPTGQCTPVLLAEDADTCSAGQLCSADAQCKLAPGGACGDASQCALGYCIDGVCCDRACEGNCEACDGQDQGICALVVGAPRGERPACADGSICNGLSEECAELSVCEAGHIAIAPDGTREDCSPFACTENGLCRTECSQVAHCAEPFLCDTEGRCVEPNFAPPSSCTTDGSLAPRSRRASALFAIALAALLRRRRHQPC